MYVEGLLQVPMEAPKRSRFVITSVIGLPCALVQRIYPQAPAKIPA